MNRIRLNNKPLKQLKYILVTLTIGLYYSFNAHTTKIIANEEIKRLNHEIIDLEAKKDRLKNTEINLRDIKRGKVSIDNIKDIVDLKSKAEEENFVTDKEHTGALIY